MLHRMLRPFNRAAAVSLALVAVVAWPSLATAMVPVEANRIWDPNAVERLFPLPPPLLPTPATPDKRLVHDALRAGDQANRELAPPKEVAQALGMLEEAHRREPNNVEVLRRLAELYGRYGTPETAVGHYQRLIKIYPANPQLYLKLANCQLRAKQTAEGVATLEALTVNFPTQVEAYRVLAHVYRDTLHAPSRADRVMYQMVEKNPQSGVGYAYRALWHLNAKRVQPAKEDSARAVDRAPNDLEVLLAAFQVCMTTKDVPRAARHLETAEKRYPDEPRVLFALIHLQMVHNEPEKVKQVAQRALNAKGLTSTMLLDLADLQLQSHDLTGVQASLAMMKKAGFLPEVITFFEARVLVVQEKWSEARTALETLASKEGLVLPHQADVHLLLSHCYKRLDLTDQALKACEQALHANPKLLAARTAYASLLFRLKRKDEALSEYRKLHRMMEPDEFFRTPGVAHDYLLLLCDHATKHPKGQWNWSEVDDLVRDGLQHDAFQDAPGRLLRAQIANDQGEPRKALPLLKSVEPQSVPAMREHQLAVTAMVQESLGQYDEARKLWSECAKHSGRGRLSLAECLGRHGTMDEAIRAFDAASADVPAVRLFLASLTVLKARTADAQAEHFARVAAWGKQAVSKEPNAKELYLRLAELHELAGTLDEAIEAYRGFLALPGLFDREQALIKNNLAYAMAVRGQNSKEAVELANQAIQTLGTIPALRDTRAIALLANGQAADAIVELRLAIANQPSGTKYFHLALAYRALGDRPAAAEALQTAHDRLQLLPEQVPAAEREKYTRLVAWLKQQDTADAKKSQP